MPKAMKVLNSLGEVLQGWIIPWKIQTHNPNIENRKPNIVSSVRRLSCGYFNSVAFTVKFFQSKLWKWVDLNYLRPATQSGGRVGEDWTFALERNKAVRVEPQNSILDLTFLWSTLRSAAGAFCHTDIIWHQRIIAFEISRRRLCPTEHCMKQWKT